MALLQCEICGGKLKGRPGGIYECEFCGVEYDTAWAKAKIQEIKGTVKVEGTVEVTGSVKLDGPVEIKGGVNIESLLKRGQLALEDGDFPSARKYFDEALNLDAESGQAYLGLLMAELEVREREELAELEEPFDDYDNYCKVVRFDPALARELEGYLDTIRSRIARKEEQERLEHYEVAVANMKAAQTIAEYAEVVRRFSALSGYRDADVLREECKKREQALRTETLNQLKPLFERSRKLSAILSARYYTVGLKVDGTVAALGSNYGGQCEVSGWQDIVAVSAGGNHTVGLKADGTVVATKYTGSQSDYHGACEVSGWQDIVQVSAGFSYTVGLKADGTVVATKYTGDQWWYRGECEVSGWQDIVAVSAGSHHTVGLKADGTVVATKFTGDQDKLVNTYCGQCEVSDWHDIVAVSAGRHHTVGLKSDGTVVAVGENESGQCNVTDWRDIVAVSAGSSHTVGLKADGTLVVTEFVKAYRNTDHGQREVSDWRLFNHVDTLEEDRKAVRAELARQEQLRQDRCAQNLCQHCGGTLKGLFTKKCVSCGKPKDY